MFKLWATIIKDFKVLSRDKVGLTLMFVMPILLVLVITRIQDNTFELVNNKTIPLVVCNNDTSSFSRDFIHSIEKMGSFKVHYLPPGSTENAIKTKMHGEEILLALVLPSNFSERINTKAERIVSNALNSDAPNVIIPENSLKDSAGSLHLYYHPVLEESFRHSIKGALMSTLQIIEGREIVQKLYKSVIEKPMPASMENEIITSSSTITEIPAYRDGSRKIPNSTQHNVPAWTLFAMFFVVISLGGSIVREKQSGSFIRLKTLPTTYSIAMISKQLTYLFITLLQVFVIFSMGIWLFPLIGLPRLTLPSDLLGLFIVSVLCGWSAISYAMCIGVLAHTQEQANGFGAVSIVILSAIGGILVPSFAMPESFEFVMKLSPLHWCLESYYVLFLEQGKFSDLLTSVIPLLIFIIVVQSIAWYSLKRKNLI